MVSATLLVRLLSCFSTADSAGASGGAGEQGQWALLSSCDAGEEEAEKLKQHGEAQGDAPIPPLKPEGLGIAHSQSRRRHAAPC